VEASPELQAVVGRFFTAMNQRDVDTVLNLHSDEPGLLSIGTDPDEWWSGYRVVSGIFEAQLGEYDGLGVTLDPGPIEAYVEGTMGWAACRPELVFVEGTNLESRCSMVFRLDRGMWKIVHSHISVGAKNEETIGIAMTTTIEDLVAAVQEEHPDLTNSTASDGTVSIAFSDIEGSTDLAVRLGDHKWLELLRWHDDVVADITSRERGQVVKSLGDGHMLAFASASCALRAAAQIQRRFQEPHDGERLRLRVGVHTGEVLRAADDFFGRAVIMAARVAASAQGDEVLASSMVVELTDSLGIFQYGEPRIVQLKGIPGDQRVFPLIWNDLRPAS
jgi:class 3 adenylate cyclase